MYSFRHSRTTGFISTVIPAKAGIQRRSNLNLQLKNINRSNRDWFLRSIVFSNRGSISLSAFLVQSHCLRFRAVQTKLTFERRTFW